MVTKKKNLILKYILISLIIGFFLLHVSPTLSLRAHLFFNGYFREAFIAEYTEVKKEESDNQFARFYTVTPPPYEKETKSELTTFKVTGVILYFTEYYGEV